MSNASQWPGWDKDLALISHYTQRICDALESAVDVSSFVQRWQDTGISFQRQVPGDTEAFFLVHAGGLLQGALTNVLQDLWRDAWQLGESSAMQVLTAPAATGTETEPESGSKPSLLPVRKAEASGVTCNAGHKHSGKYGAAGFVIYHGSGKNRTYLLHKRATDAHDPGSWGTFGGRLHENEKPYEGALRECREEIGTSLPALSRKHSVTDDHGGWKYTTFMMHAHKRFRPSVDGSTPGEVAGWGWFTNHEIKALPLHSHFAASWDTVRHSTGDTVIHRAVAKARSKDKNPLAGIAPAPLPEDPRRRGSEARNWAESTGRSVISGMVTTLTGLVAGILGQLRTGKITARQAMAEIRKILRDKGRAERIAATEVARLSGEVTRRSYEHAHVTYVRWVTAHDGKVCISCERNRQAGPVLLGTVFPSGNSEPPNHPFCIPGSVRVGVASIVARNKLNSFTSGAIDTTTSLLAATAEAISVGDNLEKSVRAVSERYYIGELIIIRTARGYELTATPNHPIATRYGWVPIAELNVGDNVLSSTAIEWDVQNPDINYIPSRIEDIAKTFPVVFPSVPTSAENFHGDGAGSKVCVIRSNGFLMNDADPTIFKHFSQDELSYRYICTRNTSLLNFKSPRSEKLRSSNFSSDRVMSGSRKRKTFFSGTFCHSNDHSLTAIPRLDVSRKQLTSNATAVDTEGYCERLFTLASEITTDEVIYITRKKFSGHVYNLETDDGWYLANAIVTHNCRCSMIPADADVAAAQAQLNPWLARH